jgi:GT2 family glycosyltransferase
VAQVDQDVELEPGWLAPLLEALGDPSVAGAQGHYVAPDGASLPARVSALDLAQRYAAIPGTDTDHVCTGNSVYRKAALEAVGGFDEAFGYGYDNDMSYRLRAAGHRLIFRRDARSTHHWRASLGGYCRQQYGLGYGRLQLVARHPRRLAGDAVSPASMMLHPVLMCVVTASAVLAALAAAAGDARWPVVAAFSGVILIALALERCWSGIVQARRCRDAAALTFPFFHLLRDVVWVGAIVVWLGRRLVGASPSPAHSMKGRPKTGPLPAPVSRDGCRYGSPVPAAPRMLVLIPAHNESGALPEVIADVRHHCPGASILVIDDGSIDDTADVAETHGVNWIQLPERMGVGSAMRAGLRYARRRRTDVVVRLDGDGQHHAEDIASLIAPIADGSADVVLGSRYVQAGGGRSGMVRLIQRLLGFCLSRLTGQPVTDPTSGFCAFNAPATRLLSELHPTGYPEPELRLLLSRYSLRVSETPMRTRARLAGRTSLTPARLVTAAARVLLAMLIVPVRPAPEGVDRD